MSNNTDVPAVTENPGRTKRRAKQQKILGPKHEAALLALLSNRSIEESAHQADVCVRTLYRWLEKPEFAEEYQKRRHALFKQSSARIQQMSGPAATMLGKVMLDPGTPPAAKIRAADSILNHGTKTVELESIAARLAELERAADEKKPGWRYK
jgi:hypothetical protein